MIPRTNRRWTNEDLDFIRRHLPFTSKRAIAASLGVTVGALRWTTNYYELKQKSDDELIEGIKEHIANIRRELEK